MKESKETRIVRAIFGASSASHQKRTQNALTRAGVENLDTSGACASTKACNFSLNKFNSCNIIHIYYAEATFDPKHRHILRIFAQASLQQGRMPPNKQVDLVVLPLLQILLGSRITIRACHKIDSQLQIFSEEFPFAAVEVEWCDWI